MIRLTYLLLLILSLACIVSVPCLVARQMLFMTWALTPYLDLACLNFFSDTMTHFSNNVVLVCLPVLLYQILRMQLKKRTSVQFLADADVLLKRQLDKKNWVCLSLVSVLAFYGISSTSKFLLTNAGTCGAFLLAISGFYEQGELWYEKIRGQEAQEYGSSLAGKSGWLYRVGEDRRVRQFDELVTKLYGESSREHMSLLFQLSEFYLRVAEPRKALQCAQKGLELARSNSDASGILTALSCIDFCSVSSVAGHNDGRTTPSSFHFYTFSNKDKLTSGSLDYLSDALKRYGCRENYLALQSIIQRKSAEEEALQYNRLMMVMMQPFFISLLGCISWSVILRSMIRRDVRLLKVALEEKRKHESRCSITNDRQIALLNHLITGELLLGLTNDAEEHSHQLVEVAQSS